MWVVPTLHLLPTVQVSKDVQKLRDYESSLLKAYQVYMKHLLAAGQTTQKGRGPVQHVRVAVRCMCQLLVTVPHFNYT